MRPNSDTRASELAMHILLMVQEAHRRAPEFLMGDIVDAARERFGISRACAYRQVRRATDVLCIDYQQTTRRHARSVAKAAYGLSDARSRGVLPGTARRA